MLRGTNFCAKQETPALESTLRVRMVEARFGCVGFFGLELYSGGFITACTAWLQVYLR